MNTLALVCVMAGSTLSQPPPAPTYTIRDLGAFAGATSTSTREINEMGDVAGYASGVEHGWIWTESLGFRGIVFSPHRTTVTALNDAGEVLIQELPISGVYDYRSYIWSDARGIVEVAPPPGTYGVAAFGLNNHGEVAGQLSNGSWRGFFWKEPLGANVLSYSPESIQTYGRSITNSGVVAALSVDPVIGNKLLLWTPSSGLIKTINEPVGYPEDINENEEVVGYGYYWEGSRGLVMLADDQGQVSNPPTAYSINDAGLIVGKMSDRALLWTGPSRCYNLRLQIVGNNPFNGSLEGRAINNSGVIAGSGHVDGVRHAFLATPISGPPPSVSSLFPPTSAAGEDLELTVNGQNFNDTSTVLCDDEYCVTDRISATMLVARVPWHRLAKPSVSIKVKTGAQLSNPQVLVLTPQEVPASSIAASIGQIISGNLGSLAFSDDQYLVGSVSWVVSRGQDNLQFVAEALTRVLEPSKIEIITEGQSSPGGLGMTVAAWNWTTNTRSNLSFTTTASVDSTVVSPILVNPGDYVDASGRIRFFVSYRVLGATGRAVTASLDSVRLRVYP